MVLDLSNNRFRGAIPGSVSRLSRITALNLADNSLSGEIPDVSLPSSFKWINLANNKLTGTVPRSFRKFLSWAFSGNNLSSLAGSEIRAHRLKVTKASEPAVLGMALGVSTFGFIVISISMIACCSSNKVDYNTLPDSNSEKKSTPEREDRIVSFEGFRYSFHFPNLLELSAEVLGRGIFGSTYKVGLKDGNEVVIKWVAELSADTAEFERLMGVVGEIRHENVALLRAYYCSENEKLLIYDYYSEGSLSSILHGKWEDQQISLSWECRLKIVIGVARGLAYIHAQNGRRLVHGNLKASNVFFNSLGFGCLSEIGITTLTNSIPPASSSQAEGYRAPEVVDSPSQESDVYSFGVLMLELLTGKSPTLHGKQFCLVRWVNSIIQNEWSAEVFDVELMRCPDIEDEMVEIMRIGIACVARMPEKRPKMPEVVDMLEVIYRARTEDQPSSDQKSPQRTRS